MKTILYILKDIAPRLSLYIQTINGENVSLYFCIVFEAMISGNDLTFLKSSRLTRMNDESVNYVSSIHTPRKPDIFEVELLETLRMWEDRYIFPDLSIFITAITSLSLVTNGFNVCKRFARKFSISH